MPPVPARSPGVACILAWLLPGAGHLYLGRRAKGLIFLGVLGILFVLGVLMHSRLQLYLGFEDPLAFLFSVAQMAVGLPYFEGRALGFEDGDVKAVTFEYGNTFTAVAGLLNILIVLDAYDTAVGRKGPLAPGLAPSRLLGLIAAVVAGSFLAAQALMRGDIGGSAGLGFPPSHLLILLAFSSLVSTAFATLLREDARGRLRFGLLAFGAFVVSTLALGWLMRPFPS